MKLPSSQNEDQETKTDGVGGQPLSPHATVAGLDNPNVFNTVSSNRSKVRRAYEIFRKSPEAVGIIKSIVDDTIGTNVRFEYVGSADTPGEQRINAARDFWEYGFNMTVTEAMVDELVAGDAYIYERLVTKDIVKSVTRDYIDEYEFNSEEFEVLGERVALKAAYNIIDEDNLTLQGAQMVPASTMYEDIDEHGNVEQFVQRVAGDEVVFSPDEIVHVSNMPMDGDVYGFSPMFSMLEELIMLAEIKDYHAKLFQNAGMANKLYMLPDENPKSQNYKQFIETLRSFRKNENTNKDMVTTGEVDVEELSSIEGTMEFEDLSKYITNTLLVGWNMPPARLGIDVGGGQDEGRSSQMSLEGYYKRIEHRQDKWETILNNELFIPYFNCKIHLESPNVKQQIREADRDTKRLNASMRMAAAGVMDRDGVRKYMGIEKTEVPGNGGMSDEEFRELAMMLSTNASDGNVSLSNSGVDNTVAEDDEDAQRQSTQEENEEEGNTDSTADNA